MRKLILNHSLIIKKIYKYSYEIDCKKKATKERIKDYIKKKKSIKNKTFISSKPE